MSEEVNKVFFVVAKNLSSGNLRFCRSNEIVTVTDDLKYMPFVPKDKNDFKAKTDYGIRGNKTMVRHWIVKMCETEDEREQLWKAGKVKNPKRTSITPTEHPMKDYEVVKEKADAKAQKKAQSSDATSAKEKEYENMLNRIKRKSVNEPTRTSPRKQGTHKQVESENKQMNSPSKKKPRKLEREEDYNHRMSNIKASEGREEQSINPQEKPNVLNVKEGKTCIDNIAGKAETYEGNAKADKSLFSSPDAEESQIRDEFKNLQFICTKCIELRHKLELANKELETFKARCVELTAERDEYLKQINAQLAKLPGILKTSKTTKHISINSMTYAVPLEADFKEMIIPEDQIYIGCGKTLPKKAICDLEPYSTVGKRLKELCLLMWPDGLHLHALQVNNYVRVDNVMQVTDQEVKVIKALLEAMEWPSEFSISEGALKKKLKHVLSGARTAFLKANPSVKSVAKPKSSRKSNKGKPRETSSKKATSEAEDKVFDIKGKPREPSSKKATSESEDKVFDIVDGNKSDSDSDATHFSPGVDERELPECEDTEEIEEEEEGKEPDQKETPTKGPVNPFVPSEDMFAGMSEYN